MDIDIRRSLLVDEIWYRETYADLRDVGDLAGHFFAHGAYEDRSPNPWMDPLWYYEANPDVLAAGANATMHYLEHGWREGRDPSPWFSTIGYLATNLSAREAKHPFLHFLERRAAGGLIKPPMTVNFIIHENDRGSILTESWRTELQARGFDVIASYASVQGSKSRYRCGFSRRGRHPGVNLPGLTVSFNGAGLGARGQAPDASLVLVWDDPKAAHAAVKRLGSALTTASSVTASRAVEAEMRGIARGAGTALYPEPMSSAYMLGASSERRTDVVWRLPIATGDTDVPLPKIREIALRLSGRKLRIIVNSDRAEARTLADQLPNAVELRTDWNALSTIQDCYADARLALIMPPPERETEVTGDVLAALAAGALPILSYAAAPALLAMLGRDLPVPFYKTLDELESIVDHYLDADAERSAYAAEGRRRVLALPTYGSRIGELMHRLGLAGQSWRAA